MADFEFAYSALKERQIPEFMREGAPDVFFTDPDIKVELPKDPLALYMMAFAIGYRQAIIDSRDADRREMLEEIEKLMTKHRGVSVPQTAKMNYRCPEDRGDEP